MILIDTSVWIDFLRDRDPTLKDLLERQQVLMHSMVKGELALGYLKDRAEILSFLGDLPRINTSLDNVVMDFIETHNIMGKGIGWVDAHLLTAVYQDSIKLWTRDKRLNAIAQYLNLAHNFA